MATSVGEIEWLGECPPTMLVLGEQSVSPLTPPPPTSLPTREHSLHPPTTPYLMPMPPEDWWATRHTVYAGCVMRMRLADSGVAVGYHQGDTGWHTVLPVREDTYSSPIGDIPGWVLHQAGEAV